MLELQYAKIVIGILAVMFAISVWVMCSKAMLVMRTDKDNKKFLARFQKTDANDLLTLDKNANYPNSTLYKLYTAGLREIKKREHPEQKLSLSGASMDAIKAAIDADLVRETQRQNAGMVLLTIAISGGPFLGLLGTVVGVMITFAAIAAAGDVNVNAIAPGIAAALLEIRQFAAFIVGDHCGDIDSIASYFLPLQAGQDMTCFDVVTSLSMVSYNCHYFHSQ